MTSAVLEKALERALLLRIPILMASTTGATAEAMLDLIGAKEVRLIVATHRERRVPPELRLREGIRKRLSGKGHIVFEDRTLPLPVKWARWLTKTFGISALGRGERKIAEQFGTGGRVCFNIARQALGRGLIGAGQTVVAVAGKEAGAEIALLLKADESESCGIQFLEMIERKP